ncbi:hypothetical protein EBQ81_00045 [bacterium]|nr:hypothetical protein [bacterium]
MKPIRIKVNLSKLDKTAFFESRSGDKWLDLIGWPTKRNCVNPYCECDGRAATARPSKLSHGQVKQLWKSMRYRGHRTEQGDMHELLADMREALKALMPLAPDRDAVAKLIVRAGGQP